MIDATLVAIHGFGSSPATWNRLNAVWSADKGLRGLLIDPFGYPSPRVPQGGPSRLGASRITTTSPRALPTGTRCTTGTRPRSRSSRTARAA